MASDSEPGVDQFGRIIEFPGQILEADILFNPAVQFSTELSTTAGKIDLQSLATHEIGHLLGLDDSGLLSSVMSPGLAPGTTVRVLSTDDVIRISNVYPAGTFFNSRASFSGVLAGMGYEEEEILRLSEVGVISG